ncbi:hypothetical protein J7K50_00010 [bacterium]|nr:hypothetical protein [bacterium]
MESSLSAERKSTKYRIGDVLLNYYAINEDQLREALKLQAVEHKKLGQILVELGYCSAEQVQRAASLLLGIVYYDVRSMTFSEEQFDLLPPDVIREYKVIPLDTQGDRIYAIMEDPLDTATILEIERLAGLTLYPCIGVGEEIEKKIAEFYDATDTASSRH